MPTHDWSNAEPDDFMAFHRAWIDAALRHLEGGVLPVDYSVSADDLAGGKRWILVRHRRAARVASIIDLVTPADKATPEKVRDYAESVIGLLNQHVNYMMFDLLGSSDSNPNGLHYEIWRWFNDDEGHALPDGEPIAYACYRAISMPEAYFDFKPIGDALPDVPIFLSETEHARLPMEPIYQAAHDAYAK
jgi:hypothetical protein